MSEPNDLPPVAEQRRALEAAGTTTARPLRVVFVGRFDNGATDIVAGLLRSLRELGHDVVHVDPSAHPQVLADPERYNGGYGPVLLDLDTLEPVLARHRPHLLVLCAGGVVLTAEQSDRLAERGVLSLGMTLSDPDVRDSVVDHVDAFDWHTTNAVLALEAYLADGHVRTSLFGFGIDRAFAVQHVPRAPELRHDVICVGHAVRRPERNAAMSALAETLDVGVYGKGWELPGVGTVAGSRLVQAMREGAVHVNFPGTKAGYVNVKCGVFESVAAGAVVATETFEEMRRYFAYDEEVLGYTDVADLQVRVRDLVADPDRLERMRRAAFARLVRDHLYERRWEALLEQLLGGPLPQADPRSARIEQWRQRVADGPAARTRRVAVAGWYGAGNVGDDLLLESVAGALERAGAAVEVVGHDPAAVLRRHGLPAVSRLDLPGVEQVLGRCDALVLGGGGLLHDYTFQANGGVVGTFASSHGSPSSLLPLALTARILRRPFHLYGIGAGPLTDPGARDLVDHLVQLADSVDVRDEESAQLLRDVAAPGRRPAVGTHPDPVYGLPVADVAPRVAPGAVAVNARPWPAAPEGFRPALVRVLRDLVARGERLVGLPMAPQDVAVTAALLREVTGAEDVEMVPLGGGTDAFVADVGASRAVVAMRLHACLLAHRRRVPVVGLSYDPKVRRHFAELGRDDLVVDLEAVAADDGAALARAVDRALAEGGTLPEPAAQAVALLEAGSTEGLLALARRVVEAPAAPRRAETIRFPGRAPTSGAPAPTAPTGPTGPAGMTAAELATVVPVSSGRLVVGGGAPDRTPGGDLREVRGSVRVHLTDGAPRRGDHAGVEFDVAGGAPVRAEVVLQSRFAERRARRGRMAVQVLVDGTVVWQEDVAGWDERCTVWCAWTPPADGSRLEVRSTALRDCEDWGWGRAGAVLVHSLRVPPWPEGAGHGAGDGVLVGGGVPARDAPDGPDDAEGPVEPEPVSASPRPAAALPSPTAGRRALGVVRRVAGRVVR
ncbi:polysaccharide pyruvyl transferase family protein [Aquipuribacter sp. SD81]|uniref:polysaccharide pyruvyl transferase family protein n=1 Tax=Aquipuribacter sp. SD81 TaxID=3127703 RepID=UPI00301A11AD